MFFKTSEVFETSEVLDAQKLEEYAVEKKTMDANEARMREFEERVLRDSTLSDEEKTRLLEEHYPDLIRGKKRQQD